MYNILNSSSTGATSRHVSLWFRRTSFAEVSNGGSQDHNWECN